MNVRLCLSASYSPHLLTIVLAHRKKKVPEFPVPSRDVTTKLSLGRNNDVITELFLPRGSLVCDIPVGDGKLVNLFLRCTLSISNGPKNKKKKPAKHNLKIKGAPNSVRVV